MTHELTFIDDAGNWECACKTWGVAGREEWQQHVTDPTERHEWADDAPDLDCPRCGAPLDEDEGETPGALCRACRAA